VGKAVEEGGRERREEQEEEGEQERGGGGQGKAAVAPDAGSDSTMTLCNIAAAKAFDSREAPLEAPFETPFDKFS